MRIRNIFLFILCLTVLNMMIMAETTADTNALKNQAVTKLEENKKLLIDVAEDLWEFAEIALLEYKSAKLLADIAEKEGFRVEREVADLPTAFVATYGSGRPVIGILAEYDALPGLSQDNVPYQKVLIQEGPGHGCGHNLFGAASLGAALILKDMLENGQLVGMIKFYGCPAEEDVGGKLYMAREGLFDDLDVCLAWHPSYETQVDVRGTQAIDDLEIEFFGRASHAAFDPWQGRSALDALEMATFGINLFREHVRPTVRIHYVVLQGGKVPNVVPDYAKLWVWARDSHRSGVKNVVQRIEKIAAGAAMATETTAKITNKGSYHEMLVNLAGSRVMQSNLERLGCMDYTPEEIQFAKKLQEETQVEEKGMVCEIKALEDPQKDPEGGSTDVAEVSWIAPTVHASVTCTPFGIPWHSWAVVAACKHSIGYKGMLLASKLLVTTGIDFFRRPDVLAEMKEEFDQKRDGYIYQSGIPADRKPPKRKKEGK
jgi:aminobenzoyl-glutamate utilization protein B